MSALAKNSSAPIFGVANSCMVMRTSRSPDECFFLTEKKCSRARASDSSFCACFQSLMLFLLFSSSNQPPSPTALHPLPSTPEFGYTSHMPLAPIWRGDLIASQRLEPEHRI